MAITKTNPRVENVRVTGDVITSTVMINLSDDSTSPATTVTSLNTNVTVSNATSAELAAIQSIISKAAALAVA